MLTEQNTPLPLVRQWSNLIPHCWESLDELTAKIRATQPSNMAAEAELYAAMSIVQAHVANGSLPVEIVHASFELFCCALWRHSKVVYSFDNTLAAELVQQADEWDDSDNLPIDVLLHPPYRCAFISCPGVIDPEIIGFFPFIVRDMDMIVDQPGSTFLMKNGDAVQINLRKKRSIVQAYRQYIFESMSENR